MQDATRTLVSRRSLVLSRVGIVGKVYKDADAAAVQLTAATATMATACSEVRSGRFSARLVAGARQKKSLCRCTFGMRV